MIIQIQIRNVYGEEKAYPMNDAAKCIANIAGTKTLTRCTLLNVLAMGCDIEELDRYGKPSRTIKGGPERRYGDIAHIRIA
jgi:hypothetical protein